MALLKTSLFLIVALSFSSCNLLTEQKEDQPVAKVFNTYLYASDLKQAIPDGTSSKDSIVIARRFVDTWVKNQLMLSRAELALSEEQKDFEKRIEEYRTSLLIYSYRQKLLQQKLDTVVNDSEIQEYYENNLNNFILSDEIVKATFVKVPLSSPNIPNLRMWIRSERETDLDKLEKYCMNYADKYDTFDNKWIFFSSVAKQIPMEFSQPARYLRYNKNIETRDSAFHYFVHIIDHKSEGDFTPLDLINDDIVSIILNKRKIQFYNDLEKQVYNEGVNRNQFEIY